jgi:hypothetical protein
MKFPEPNPIFDKPKQTKPQLNNIKLFKFYFFYKPARPPNPPIPKGEEGLGSAGLLGVTDGCGIVLDETLLGDSCVVLMVLPDLMTRCTVSPSFRLCPFNVS